jgi:hypothetical protein
LSSLSRASSSAWELSCGRSRRCWSPSDGATNKKNENENENETENEVRKKKLKGKGRSPDFSEGDNNQGKSVNKVFLLIALNRIDTRDDDTRPR